MTIHLWKQLPERNFFIFKKLKFNSGKKLRIVSSEESNWFYYNHNMLLQTFFENTIYTPSWNLFTNCTTPFTTINLLLAANQGLSLQDHRTFRSHAYDRHQFGSLAECADTGDETRNIDILQSGESHITHFTPHTRSFAWTCKHTGGDTHRSNSTFAYTTWSEGSLSNLWVSAHQHTRHTRTRCFTVPLPLHHWVFINLRSNSVCDVA